MSPRAWKVTVDGRTITVVAGTQEAAEKRAARQAKRLADHLARNSP